MGTKETAWKRIEGDAPLSILIDPETDDRLFVDQFLRDLPLNVGEDLYFPVRFSCRGVKDVMDFWVRLYEQVRSTCSSLFLEDDLQFVADQDADLRNALEPASAFPCIECILDVLKEGGYKILLILEDFEAVFDWMDLPNISVFHSFTAHAVLVTVSSTYPDALGEERFGSVYFLNQFLTVSFV